MKRRLMMTDIIVLVLGFVLFFSAHVSGSEIDHFMEEGEKGILCRSIERGVSRMGGRPRTGERSG